MKNLGLRRIGIFFAIIVLAGCTTTMFETMTFRSEPEQPHWARKFHEWKRAQVDSNLYFLGVSKREFKELEKKHLDGWTEQQAFNEASTAAKAEIASAIESNIKSEIKDYFKVKNDVADEEFLSEILISSSVAIQNSLEYDRYTETHIKITKKRNTTTTMETTWLWIVYSVPKEDIEKAQARIIEELKEQDEKKRQENRERRMRERVNEQERFFDDLSGNVKKLSNVLSSYNEDKQFGKRYEELQTIYKELQNTQWKLQNLNLLENRSDETGENYKKLKVDVEKMLQEYNPVNRQSKEIENLLRQINDKSNIIQALNYELQVMDNLGGFREKTEKELRDEITKRETLINQLINENHGHSILSQTILVSHPQKPNEIKSASGKIFAATGMVSNRDFISFCISNGINSLSKSEQGLDNPVVSVTWNEAAKYCNWLSRLYGYEQCYIETNGQIVYEKGKKGYRLPEHDEIAGLLDERLSIIDINEFSQIGIWSSDGGQTGHKVYKLSEGLGTAIENLASQSFDNAMRDPQIGFRVVRNAE